MSDKAYVVVTVRQLPVQPGESVDDAHGRFCGDQPDGTLYVSSPYVVPASATDDPDFDVTVSHAGRRCEWVAPA